MDVSKVELSDKQREGMRWLRDLPHRYLADPPGYGKTRTSLAAVGDHRTLVVAPAAIRDAKVWQGEAARIGFDAPLTVVSYHQLVKGVDESKYDAVIFDEAHWLKSRKVSWGQEAERLGRSLKISYLLSGTPTPNIASELWGQLRVIKDMPAFWPWVNQWLFVGQSRYSDFEITGTLLGCVEDNCYNAREVTERDCVHWAKFRAEVQHGWMLARPEEDLDLPESAGEDVPLYTPMKPAQKKAYNELKADFITWVQSQGAEIPIEAVSNSQKFAQLWQMSTGISSVDPGVDPDDRHSGKLALVAEMLEDKDRPTLAATYFKNSALALGRVCERLGKTYAFFGASTTAKERERAVKMFQDGSLDVMIGSIAVVGEGLTLTAADSVFMVERMWTPAKNTQVIRRVKRRGQTRAVGVRQFLTPDTADAGQWEMLHMKTNRIGRVDPKLLAEGKIRVLS